MSAPAAGARRTVFEVESEQRWRIWLLFALLLALVLGAVWLACLLLAVITYLAVPVVDLVALLLRPRVIALLLGVSALVAVVYWFGAQVGARGRLLHALHGQPLDPGDRYHRRLADVVEELRLATGGPRIDCRVVATRGLNAFSFSDLHGGGVIGVTEGALARLSRQQLEAVVAHEFAQILSGTYVTVTVGCLLFGTSAALAEDLQDGMLAAAGTRAAPLALGVPLIGLWLWLLELASSVVLAAVDRERQRQADTAAARYTRDPLSLAEALRIIARHPGGSGFVPAGLAALCIRGADDGTPRLRRGEPSLDERVAALLSLANAAPDEFERQVRAADERFEDREHWAAAPGAAAQPAAQAGAAPAVEHVSAAALAAAAAAHGVAASLAAPAPAPASARGASAGGACPSCGHSLEPADYEGVRVAVCRACGGRLAGSDEVRRILARREVGFTPEQQHLADVLAADGDQLRRAANMARGRGAVSGVPCPRCGRTMVRGHYDYQYAVEVDRCLICDLIWFEKDELEALQILTERATG